VLLIALAAGWIGGLLLGAANLTGYWLAAPPIIAGLLAIRFRARGYFFWLFLTVGGLALADLRYVAYDNAIQSSDLAQYTLRSAVQLQGVVAGDPITSSFGTQFPLDVRVLERGGEWAPASGLVLVRGTDSARFRIGDRLEIKGVLQPPDPQLPPQESFLRQEGIVAVVNRPAVTPLDGWELTPLTLLARVHAEAADALNRALPEPEAGLARGIALGQRETLDLTLKDDFSRTNTSHILAVDGYKVGLVANSVESVLRQVLRPLLSSIGTVGGIVLYTIFVGASPSAQRASIMGGIYVIGRAFGRPRDTLNALAIAALGMTALNPYLLWSVAFQLSFVTSLGMAAMAPFFEEKLTRRLGFLREAIGSTLAAEIASAPLVVVAFDHVSVASLPVHALIMPLLPLAILLSLLTAGFGLLLPSLGILVGHLAWVPLAAIVGVVEWAGGLPLAALPIPQLGLPAVVAVYAVLGLAILSRQNPFFGPGIPLDLLWQRVTGVVPPRFLVPGVALPVVVLGALVFSPSSPVDRLRLLDVAGGDAALIQFADGTSLYVQGGAPADQVARAVDPSLPFWNRSIDLAVLTAVDDNALTDLTQLAGRESIRQVVRPAAGFSSVAENRWAAGLPRQPIAVVPIDDGSPGGSLALGDGRTLAVYPLAAVPKQGRSAALEASVTVRLTDGPATVLWASAIPADQIRLVESGLPLSAHILKLVGRTPRWGLDPAFFQKVDPDIIILSSGVADRFARPTPGTLTLLGNRPVYRTDLDGEVVISMKPEGLVVETARGR